VKVISFDPGITTGYTFSTIRGGFLSINADQEKWTVEGIWDYLVKVRPDFIIYEGFNYRNRARAGLELFPVQLIGVINLYGCKHKIVRSVNLFEQQPGTGFDYFTDIKLKADKLYKPGKPHAMDALRHLLHWWTFGPGYRYNENGYGAA
jgi:hypothetical protein